ncbi:MAG: hypothetical protein OXG92_10090 [Chloroflexi bacterium]|nr:hypothetical protein [Chloroflexota bacterium]MCY3581203.1 hypothetical protein [Chloroflexota bacterium]MCY3716801.1 hypothetical protein [Chloroflexota bacterium]MDE2649168.1 hypothetical protein [Chloroflexota bacterium]MXX49550.1 hypothetical protein [Chloroflexota bacterium]
MRTIRIHSILCVFVLFFALGSASAQDSAAQSSPAGLSMLVLFVGIAGIVGVFAIRWSQSTGDNDDAAD